jgi:hypothetical protein
LNTSQVLFADVDFPRPASGGLIDSILALFSPKRRDAKRQAVIAETIGRVESWAKENPARGFRMYRTREGLRLLFTDKLYEPKSDETAAILSGVQADPMYVKLTQAQECFRARLTAKPWRCGCTRPPASFPWANAKAEEVFRKWERQYTQTDASYRACEFVRQVGQAAGIPEIDTVAAAHDRGARASSNAPLA